MELVSIIIPVYKQRETLDLCLAKLRRQTYPASSLEILVVDNSPNFELVGERDSFAPAILLHQPIPGSYAARNMAIEHASGEYLAFTDADCLPEEDWIERGIAALKEYPDGALIAGRVQVFSRVGERPTAIELWQLANAFPQELYATRKNFGVTANVLIRADIVRKVGGFDVTLKSGGDNEWGNRIFRAGYPVVYRDEVVIRHPARRDLQEVQDKMKRLVRGVWALEQQGLKEAGSFMNGLGADLRPPILSIANVMRNSSLGSIWNRIRAASVLTFMRYYRAYLRMRLLWEARGGRIPEDRR